MTAEPIKFVTFSPAHLDGAVALSQQAKWPHRREDWAMVEALSDGIAAVSGDRVVGTAFATPYGENAATINMVIVDESMRGQGIGRKLMDAALAKCEGREARLVATEDGLPLYQKLGFRPSGTVLQYQGVIGNNASDSTANWASATDVSELIAVDHAACGLDRSRLITRLSETGRLAVLRENGRIVGFAVLRDFGRGEVAGPVVARTLKEAQSLLGFLFAARAGQFLRVDTTKDAGLAPWLEAQGLAHVGGGISMRRGGHQMSPSSEFHVFALASQAFG